jgi:hypothetical protein
MVETTAARPARNAAFEAARFVESVVAPQKLHNIEKLPVANQFLPDAAWSIGRRVTSRLS